MTLQTGADVTAPTPNRLDCIECGDPRARTVEDIGYCNRCGTSWPARYAADTKGTLTPLAWRRYTRSATS